jgi:hypothetical protein
MLQDSKHCDATSFSQIIDVYVQLKHQDGFEMPPALRVILRTKPRFSTQLQSLMKNAQENKGLSELHIIDSLIPNALQPNIDTEGTHEYEIQTEQETTEQEAILSGQLEEIDDGHSHSRDDGDSDHVDINQEENEDIYSTNYEDEEYAENGNGENEENEEDGELIESVNEPIGVHGSPVKDEETEPFTADAYPDDNDVQTGPHEDPTVDEEDGQYEEPSYVEPDHSEIGTANADESAENDLSAPQDYNVSSGSSTVQGENDGVLTSQFDVALDDDHRLTHYQDDPNLDDTLGQSPTPSEGVQGQCGDCSDFEDLLIKCKDDQTLVGHANPEYSSDQVQQHEDDIGATHPVPELPSTKLTPKSESKPSDTENQDLEGFIFDLDEADQQWDSEEQGHDDPEYQVVDDTNAPAEHWEESVEQEGTNHDAELDAAFDLGHSTSGTFQVPDESVEDDEDTINYDDDEPEEEEEEEVPEPAIIADQAHPSDSPSVKRPREEDHEGGGEDGDDTGPYKRLRLDGSHVRLTLDRLEATQVEMKISSQALSDLGF